MTGDPDVGARATATTRVTHADLASAVGIDADDVFPAVYATSKLVALMEIAAARVLAAFLAPGERSVGVSVDITHDASTAVGATVTATAVFTGRNGKRFGFEVSAHEGGMQVGRGKHQRAVVDAARLERGAVARATDA